MSLGGSLPDTLLQRAATNERRVVIAALVVVTALGLWATFHTGDLLMSPASPAPGTVAYAVLLFIMWWTMMLAMMLPSAAPAILTYGAVSRKFAQKGVATAPLAIFVAGYAAVWTGFGAATVALQMSVHNFVPLTGMMAVISTTLGAALLIAAGLYQLSPLKRACLRKCQTPLMFFARNWRKGNGGALRMGLSHGLYCLGCCWVLMGLLFYGGVMELRWIVGLALYVAAEKIIPASTRLSRLIGILLIGWGLWAVSGLASASASEHHAADEPVSEGDRVAVVVVHRIADQRPGQTPRKIVRLLCHGGEGAPRFVQGEMRDVLVPVAKLEPRSI